MILTVLGNRPQLIKSVMVSKALQLLHIKEYIVYTYQHYNYDMYTAIVQDYNINITANEHIIEQPHSIQDYLYNIEVQIKQLVKKIQLIIVYGDTNSTVAGALFAKKNNLKLIHIEAGERSYNNTMPEEHNRIMVDYSSTVLCCVNSKAKSQLSNSIYKGNKIIVGDVMLDMLQYTQNQNKTASNTQLIQLLQDNKSYYYFTMHRQSNTVSYEHMHSIFAMLGKLKHTILYPMHPRVQALYSSSLLPINFVVTKPLQYNDNIIAIANANAVLTDSGGVQKEAYWLQKKCVTLRNDTEWVETLAGGWNTLYHKNTTNALIKILKQKPDIDQWNIVQFGNGKAAKRIANVIQKLVS